MTAHPDRIALSAAVRGGKWFAAAASIAIHVGLAGAVLVWDSSFEPPKPPTVLTVDLVIETALPGPAKPTPEKPGTVSAAATVARTAPEMAEVEAEQAPTPETIPAPVSPPALIAFNGRTPRPLTNSRSRASRSDELRALAEETTSAKTGHQPGTCDGVAQEQRDFAAVSAAGSASARCRQFPGHCTGRKRCIAGRFLVAADFCRAGKRQPRPALSARRKKAWTGRKAGAAGYGRPRRQAGQADCS